MVGHLAPAPGPAPAGRSCLVLERSQLGQPADCGWPGPINPILIPAWPRSGVVCFCAVRAVAESASTSCSSPALPLSGIDIYVDMDTDDHEAAPLGCCAC